MIQFSIIRRATLAAVGVLMLTSVAAAQVAPMAQSSKIGFVDIDQVTQKANFVKSMLGNIEATIGERQKGLEAKQEEYKRLRNEMDQKNSVAAEAELDAIRKKRKDLLNEIEEENYQLQKMVDKAKRDQMEPAIARILEMVKTIGKEEGFDLILRGDSVLYSSPAVDITEKVIERLNRESVSDEAAKTTPAEGEKKDDPAVSDDAKPSPTPAAKAAPKTSVKKKSRFHRTAR